MEERKANAVCTRMITLTYDEDVAALDSCEHTGRARLTDRSAIQLTAEPER